MIRVGSVSMQLNVACWSIQNTNFYERNRIEIADGLEAKNISAIWWIHVMCDKVIIVKAS